MGQLTVSLAKRTNIVLHCLLLILFVSSLGYSALSQFDIEQQIKARMNAAPGNRCVGLSLNKLTDEKYSGVVEFENGTRYYTIDVTVSGSQMQYTIGQAIGAERKQPPKSEAQKPTTSTSSIESLTSQQEVSPLKGQYIAAIEQQLMNQMNIGSGNKCVSASLREVSGTKYTGKVTFANNVEANVEVFIFGKDLRYTLSKFVQKPPPTNKVIVENSENRSIASTPDSNKNDDKPELTQTSQKTSKGAQVADGNTKKLIAGAPVSPPVGSAITVERGSPNLNTPTEPKSNTHTEGQNRYTLNGPHIENSSTEEKKLTSSAPAQTAAESPITERNITTPQHTPSVNGTNAVSSLNRNAEIADPIKIAAVSCVILLLILIAIGVSKSYRGQVTFFSSYFDVFLSFLPFITLLALLGSEAVNKKFTPTVVIIACTIAVLYNFGKAYYDNGHAKFVAFCVGLGRITLGYIIPLLTIAVVFGGNSIKRNDESDGEYVARSQRETVQKLILGGFLIFLLHSLVRKATPAVDTRFVEEDNASEFIDNDSDNDTEESLNNMADITMLDPYEVLNLSKKASPDEIRTVYRNLAVQYHPDKVAHLAPEFQELANEKMKKINCAYERLTGNPTVDTQYVNETTVAESSNIDTPADTTNKQKSKLTEQEMEQMRQELAHPDMRPCNFDITIDGWLWRINTWGKLTFWHHNPENKIKQYITQAQFVKRMTDPTLMSFLGKWNIDLLDVTKLRIWRKFLSVKNKTCTEEFIITCDLKKKCRNG